MFFTVCIVNIEFINFIAILIILTKLRILSKVIENEKYTKQRILSMIVENDKVTYDVNLKCLSGFCN